MVLTDKNSILEAMKAKTEEVDLGNGKSVIASELSAGDFMRLWTDPKNQKDSGKIIVGKNGNEPVKTVDMNRFIPALVANCIVDESGDRVFTDDDIELVAKLAQGPFMKVAEVVKRLNGMNEENVKNSGDNQAESSSLPSA